MKSICTIAAVCVAALALGCDSDSKQRVDATSPGAIGESACCSSESTSECCSEAKTDVAPGAVSESNCSDSAAQCPFSGASK